MSDLSVIVDVSVYPSGSAVLLMQRYTDPSTGDPADPTSVALRTKNPAGVIVTQTVANPEVGTYTCEFIVDFAGRWVYEWRSTGGNSATAGEFNVLPSPIDDPTQGLIAQQVRSLMPATWDALSKVDYMGPALLSERILIAKYMALPAVVATQDEVGFSPLMRDYIATLAAIEIIPAGLEYWAQQKISISTTGTNETTSFTDRQYAMLKGLLPVLRAKAASLASNPSIIPQLSLLGEGPAVSGNDDGVLITQSPFDFLPAFGDAAATTTSGGE